MSRIDLSKNSESILESSLVPQEDQLVDRFVQGDQVALGLSRLIIAVANVDRTRVAFLSPNHCVEQSAPR